MDMDREWGGKIISKIGWKMLVGVGVGVVGVVKRREWILIDPPVSLRSCQCQLSHIHNHTHL